MDQGFETEFRQDLTLGERIVQAARMAVAIHLYESAAPTQSFRQHGQQVVIGGAGPRVVGNEPAGRVDPALRTRHG